MRPDHVRLFYPFSFRLSSDLRLEDVPERLTQIVPEAIQGALLTDVFRFRRPKQAPTWEQILRSGTDSFELVGINKPVRFRGAFLLPDASAAWFIASPVLDDLPQMAALGFRVDDFRPFDSTLDTLVLQQSSRLAIRDADALSNEVKDLRDNNQRILQELNQESLRNADSDNQGTVLSSMMHDVMSPLAMATAASQLVEDTLDRICSMLLSPETNPAQLMPLLDEAVDMNRHVRQGMMRSSELMRLVKQISIDQSSMRERKVDLLAYLGDLILLFAPLSRKHNVRFHVDGDAGITFSQPGRLARIVTNLVENSVIHGFNGRASGSITIRLERNVHDLMITYRDDGVGMDADTLARHIDPYFTTRADSGGSGLGTYAIRSIIETHFGGSIHVESTPGAGTTYILTIPCTDC